MKRIWVSCWIGFSVALASCQTMPALQGDAICSLRAIEVSEETRAHLRAPLENDTALPAGYAQFLRQLSAHNIKIRTHCGLDADAVQEGS